MPKSCQPCRRRRRLRERWESQGLEVFDAPCSVCGVACVVPFNPDEGRAVLCVDCYGTQKDQERGTK